MARLSVGTPSSKQVKFHISESAWTRLHAQAEQHGFGVSGVSANDWSKMLINQFSLVPADQSFLALAALQPFQVKPTQPAKGTHSKASS